jgi:hypothetical protein
MIYQLLNWASHVPSGDGVVPEMQQAIMNLEKVGKPILHICHQCWHDRVKQILNLR